MDLAKTLERSRFDGIFIADVLGVSDVYAGGPEAALRNGIQLPVDNPMMLASAIAEVTNDLGIGVTAATGTSGNDTSCRRWPSATR